MIKVNETKENMMTEFTKLTNTDDKTWTPLKKINNNKNKLTQIKLPNYAIEDYLYDLKPYLTLLNEIMFATATVISLVTRTYKQNSLK